MIFFEGIVAGQPELESKDCHPRMKIRMISIILCNNYFRKNEQILQKLRMYILYSIIMRFWPKSSFQQKGTNKQLAS